MTQPVHHRLHPAKGQARRGGRAVDQDHRQAQGAGGVQLRLGPRAARVLGDDVGDPMVAQQGGIARNVEGAAGDDGRGAGQGQGPLGRVDKPQEVMVLGAGRKGASVWRPMARKTREGTSGRASTAAATSATRTQRSPAPGAQAGRSSAQSGVSVAAQARAALRLISAAKGWVASITWLIRSARNHAANPSAPPKPPTRTGTGWATGASVRPA